MGVSTDAVLFYGYDLTDVDLDLDFEELDVDDDDIFAALEAICRPHGVEVGIHCSAECPEYYLYTKEEKAWRGYPVKLGELPHPDVSPSDGDIDKLKKAAKEVGLDDFDGPPSWYLASYWG